MLFRSGRHGGDARHAWEHSVRHLRPLHDPLEKEQQILLSVDQYAHQIYQAVIGQKFHTILKDEQIIV